MKICFECNHCKRIKEPYLIFFDLGDYCCMKTLNPVDGKPGHRTCRFKNIDGNCNEWEPKMIKPTKVKAFPHKVMESIRDRCERMYNTAWHGDVIAKTNFNGIEIIMKHVKPKRKKND